MNDAIFWVGAAVLGMGFGYFFGRGVLSWFVVVIMCGACVSSWGATVTNKASSPKLKVRPKSDYVAPVPGCFVEVVNSSDASWLMGAMSSSPQYELVIGTNYTGRVAMPY